jgi:hypothetical protein
MLWQVEGTRTFLLGSCHELPESYVTIPESWEIAWQESNQLVVEARIDQITAPLFEEYSDGRQLSDDLSADLYSTVRKAWVALDRDEKALPRVKPWVAGLVMSSILRQKIGLRSDFGVDRRFLQSALSKNREIHSLESITAGLDCFRLQPVSEQSRMLSYFVADIDRAKRETLSVVEAWIRGDRIALEQFLESHFALFPNFFDALITRRNKAWLPALVRFANCGIPTLIVIGVLHTVGRGSVPELLQQQGHRLSRIQ